MKYIALLRGVNAGGKRRVPKEEFKKVLENLGFTNVLIDINSGNAIFESSKNPQASKVQSALEKHFGFAIPTLIISVKKFKSITHSIPEDWTNDAPKPDKSGQKSDVIYLFESVNSPDILKKIGYNPAIETMIYNNLTINPNENERSF